MRADRLLSIMMILQSRGRVKADDLAEELEVSVRTIYRDITALSTAGVPVYCERGPGGGVELIERYRTDLTGLSTDEARALFMLSIPTPLDELGVGSELKAAMLKLSAALPATRQDDQKTSRQRVHLDWTPWFHEQEPQPHLQTTQQAVWEDRLLYVEYYTEAGEWLGTIQTTLAPYGLVAKSGNWYLVGRRKDGNISVIRTTWIIEARILDENFQRPENFDLGKFWLTWRNHYESRKPFYSVKVNLAPQLLENVSNLFGENVGTEIASAKAPAPRGWFSLTLPFESLEDARQRLLPLGGAVEVIEPVALRMSLIDYAAQIAGVYET